MSLGEDQVIVLRNNTVQVTTPGSWGINGTRLQAGEISTAATVARRCGSIISRRQESNLMDDIQEGFGIIVQGLPLWLRNFQFTRDATILGARMRRIRVPKIMEELDMFKLSGLATFVTLCCRYTENESTIKEMLLSLILGELGYIVKIDRDFTPQISNTFRGHIATFVSSCLDADRSSDISNRINTWMGGLQMFCGSSWDSKDLFLRRKHESFNLMGQFLGAKGTEENMTNHPTELHHDASWAKVHNTLYITSAYIALAAAAHGASIVVECVLSHSSRMFPKEPEPEEKKSTFLVRLWFTQPPEYICAVLRHLRQPSTSEGNIEDEEVILVGGTLEIVTCIAKKLEFPSRFLERSPEGALLELWKRGAEYGKQLHWLPKAGSPDFKSETLAYFRLECPEWEPKSSQRKDGRLRHMIRPIDEILNASFSLDKYSSLDIEDEKSEAGRAANFVLVSILVEALRNTIRECSDSTDSYALNLATLRFRDGSSGIYGFFLNATCSRGVQPSEILLAVASIWGGMYTHTGTNKEIMGVVTQHCTIIFDMLRDPLTIIYERPTAQLLSIWRGAVPMLPRDPTTNFICGSIDDRVKRSRVGHDYKPKPRLLGDQLNGPMLVTFELFEKDATRGTFCFWYGGQLRLEVVPHILLSRALTGQVGPGEFASADYRYVKLSQPDILELGCFECARDAGAIVVGLEDRAWCLFAVGCVVSEHSIHISWRVRDKADNEILSFTVSCHGPRW